MRRGGPIAEVSKRAFHVEANIHPGNSGSPTIDRTSGEILGVISQAVMDANPDTREHAEFTRVDACARCSGCSPERKPSSTA